MIPVVQDRVRFRGSEETFLVVGVDYTRRKVDVVATNGEFRVIADVPFHRLQSLNQAHRPVLLSSSAAA